MNDFLSNLMDRMDGGEMHSEISTAVINGDHDKVLELLEGGENANWADAFGLTLLMYAADYGREQIVNALLQAGADKDQKDMNGLTARDHAAKKNYNKIVEILS